MAAHAYVGKPGSGKSYGVVEHVVIPSLKQNRHVVTNIPLAVSSLEAVFGGRISQLPDDWYDSPDLASLIPPGCVAIIDECWRRWPAGKNINQANKIDQSLLAEHRHRVDAQNNSMRIVLVTQDLAQISSWVRVFIENTYRIRKLSKKVFKVDIYTGPVTGDSPPRSKLVRTTAGTFKKDVYQYYKSATQSLTGDVGNESSADGRASILRSWGLWLLIGIAVLSIIFGVIGVKRFFTPPTAAPLEASQSSKPSAPTTPSQPAEPPVSTSWRLVGFVHPTRPNQSSTSTSEALAVIADNNGSTRFISFSHCRYFPDFTEAYCVVDGFKITNWSLKRPLPIVGGFAGGGV